MRGSSRPWWWGIRNLASSTCALGLLLASGQAAGAAPVRVPQRFQPPASWAELADAVTPAVVSIKVATLEGGESEGEAAAGEPAQDPFEFFFGEREPGAPAPDDPDGAGAEPSDEQPELTRVDSGGSGFLVSADGLVVTNYHVIAGATRVDVSWGGQTYPAEIVGIDPPTDLALLGIAADGDLPYLELGDSDELRVGDWLMVVGNPLNLDLTVTTGVVSAKGRSIGLSELEDFIQTDAAINFGNSGGPALDMRGRVVGIATAINYGADNVGFLVPSNVLQSILPQLVEYGDVVRGALGATVRTLSAEQAPAFGVEAGVVVNGVAPGGAAEGVGLGRGDVIVALDGAPVASTADLVRRVSGLEPGTEVRLDVVRDGTPFREVVVLAERPRREGTDDHDAAGAADEPAEEEEPLPELLLADLDAATRAAMPGVAGALVTFVDPLSWLYDQGLRRGQVISEVDGEPLAGAAELEERIAAVPSGEYLRLFVRRDGAEGFHVVFQGP